MPEQIPVKSSWTVGSSTDCDLVVAKPMVSRKHCRITLHGGQYSLEDLSSSNGTFVNGHRLTPGTPVFVSMKDAILLGPEQPMPWPSTLAASAEPTRTQFYDVAAAAAAAANASQATQVYHPPSNVHPPANATQVMDATAATQLRNTATTQIINIGRAPENEVTIDFPMVSWKHARIVRNGSQWTIEDLNSRNGVALNHIDNKIQRTTLLPTDEIYLGSYKLAASRIMTGEHIAQGESAFERVQLTGNRMVIGRDPASGYTLNFPMISWQHAALERTAEGIFVEDLGSRNGTYVDGARISGKTLVRPGQEISLGSFRFQLLEDGALAKREYIGNVTIEVAGITVNAPNGTQLLDPISLTIYPSELVALMGPAGAGKTTFLKAINGYTRPAGGSVRFNGSDLYQHYDLFRQQMSYVPQDDIVHAQLTVREALYFSAKLRTDLNDQEIEARIETVLTSLGIEDKKDTIIGSPERKVLSGGQRKRVNIAMELIADAPVIFLDEPTSGLSSYDAENVVQVLKKLSEAGTTIVTTIHQPSLDIFKQFDSLIMISRERGGRGGLAYFGPAHPNSIEFFEPTAKQVTATGKPERELNPEMLLSGLAKQPTPQWIAKYEQSEFKKLYVTDRAGKVPSTPKSGAEGAVRKFSLGQWWTLVRRNYILKIRDRGQAIITIAQAPAFGILLGLVFGPLKYHDGPGWQTAIRNAVGIEFLMVIAAIWFGCNNVARDIVGEWTVFQRERMVSLKLPSYIFSKLTIAAITNLFQCLTLLGLVSLFCHLEGDIFLKLAILYLSSLVGSAIGLCISGRASTTEAAIAMLPLILLPMIALGGGLTPVSSMSTPMQMAAEALPSRWAFESDLLLEAKHDHLESGIHRCNLAEKMKTPANCFNFEPQQDLASIHFPPEKSAKDHPDTRARSEASIDSAVKNSFLILGGMLVFWTALAIFFLRMRDIQ